MILPPDDQPPRDYRPGTGPMVGILWALTFTVIVAFGIIFLIAVLAGPHR